MITPHTALSSDSRGVTSGHRGIGRRVPAALLAAVAFVAIPLTVSAQIRSSSSALQLPSVIPGSPHAISLVVPTSERAAGTVRYTVEPLNDVFLSSARTGSLSWNPATDHDLAVKLQLTVPKSQAQGSLVAVRIGLRWADGKEESIDVRVNVAPLPAGTSTKDMEAEVIPVPRSAAPGGVVKLMYTIYSYEENDERVRLRVNAPGWRLLDPEAAERDILVEAWEIVEGELYVVVPEGAAVGDRQLVRLLAEVVGESGEIEAKNYVSIAKSGGSKPGVPTITGASTFGLSQLGLAGIDGSRQSGALELSSKFGKASNFSFSFDQGLQTNLSNFRYEEERTRVTGNLRHAGWDVSFGNYVSAQGNALTGPYVRGRGASIRRPSGLLVSELVVAQPNMIGGLAGGHVVRGRAGVRTPKVLLALSASDFGRPSGGYSTISTIQTTVLDAETQEQLDYERRLTAAAASNRVKGVGLEAKFQPVRAHRISVRSGGLWLSNAKGISSGGASNEASYSLNTKPAALNLRWRETPATVSGISIQGDEIAADGNVRVFGDVRLIGRAYQNSTDTVGSDLFSRGEGGSLGVRFMRGARRVEVRGNYRESQYSAMTVSRTVSVLAGVPLGPFLVSGNADIGRQETPARTDRVVYYRGDLRWVKDIGTVSFNASHSETLGVGRQRFDLIASVKAKDLEFAGGAWATRGYTSGGKPGMWTNVGVPVGYDSTLTLGVDYSPLTWIAQPSLRGLVTIRKRFSVSMPFMNPTMPGGSSPDRQAFPGRAAAD
jgi:hypothetical protein